MHAIRRGGVVRVGMQFAALLERCGGGEWGAVLPLSQSGGFLLAGLSEGILQAQRFCLLDSGIVLSYELNI